VHGGATKGGGENSSKESNGKKKKQKVHKCDWPGCELAFTAPAKLADHRNSHTGGCEFLLMEMNLKINLFYLIF
jgi:hypothetical protein